MPFPLIAVLAPIVLTATSAYWATKCNEENEVDETENKGSNKLSRDNFKKCYDACTMYEDDRKATEKCLEYIKNYSFVDNPSYDKCVDSYKEIHGKFHTGFVLERCMKITKSKQLVDNPGFDYCCGLYENSNDKRDFDVIEMCAKKSQEFTILSKETSKNNFFLELFLN